MCSYMQMVAGSPRDGALMLGLRASPHQAIADVLGCPHGDHLVSMRLPTVASHLLPMQLEMEQREMSYKCGDNSTQGSGTTETL